MRGEVFQRHRAEAVGRRGDVAEVHVAVAGVDRQVGSDRVTDAAHHRPGEFPLRARHVGGEWRRDRAGIIGGAQIGDAGAGAEIGRHAVPAPEVEIAVEQGGDRIDLRRHVAGRGNGAGIFHRRVIDGDVGAQPVGFHAGADAADEAVAIVVGGRAGESGRRLRTPHRAPVVAEVAAQVPGRARDRQRQRCDVGRRHHRAGHVGGDRRFRHEQPGNRAQPPPTHDLTSFASPDRREIRAGAYAPIRRCRKEVKAGLTKIFHHVR